MRGYCRDCGDRVIVARTEAMRWQLLNPGPDPAGNVLARSDGRGNWYARTVKPGTRAVPPEQGPFMPHKASCAGKPARATVNDLLPGGRAPSNVIPINRPRRARAATRRTR